MITATDRHPTAATLAVLRAFLPGAEQDRLVRDFGTAAGLLRRYVRQDAMDRLNDQMHDALVLFCMDVGFPIFEQSTLRNRINAGRHLEAVGEFLPHHTRAGKVDRTMKLRRAAEARLFCGFPG